MTNAPTYDFYFASLAGDNPMIDQNAPQPGFYRARQDGGLIGVAIWWDDERLVALVGDEYQNPSDVWMDVAGRPVKEDYYRAWSETGRWPDDLPEEAKPKPTISLKGGPDEIRKSWDNALQASNLPTALEEMTDQIDSAVKAAFSLDFGETISDDASRDRAQALRARLNELSGKASKIKEAEKRPHLDAGKKIDERWQPLVKKAKGAADRLRASLSAYETAERNKRLAAEKAAETSSLIAEKEGASATAAPFPSTPPPTETRIKGAYGRAAGKHLKRVAVIEYWPDVIEFCMEDDEFKAVCQKIVQRAVDAGERLPHGVEVKEEIDVR